MSDHPLVSAAFVAGALSFVLGPLAAVSATPPADSECATALTVRSTYESLQRAQASIAELSWQEIEEALRKDSALGKEGALNPQEIAQLAATQKLAPLLKSGLLQDTLRAALLSLGIHPQHLLVTLRHIQAQTLSVEEIETIIDQMVVLLQRSHLPEPTLQNMDQIAELEKRYQLSPRAYRLLTQALYSKAPSVLTEFKAGILNAILRAEPEFVRAVAKPGIFKRLKEKWAPRPGHAGARQNLLEASLSQSTPRHSEGFQNLVTLYAANGELSVANANAFFNALERLIKTHKTPLTALDLSTLIHFAKDKMVWDLGYSAAQLAAKKNASERTPTIPRLILNCVSDSLDRVQLLQGMDPNTLVKDWIHLVTQLLSLEHAYPSQSEPYYFVKAEEQLKRLLALKSSGNGLEPFGFEEPVGLEVRIERERIDTKNGK